MLFLSPMLTGFDITHGALFNAVQSANLALGKRSFHGKTADLDNLIFSQYCARGVRFLTKYAVGVSLILTASHIFKVLNTVVIPNSVNVIDIEIRMADECEKHKPMDLGARHFPVSEKANATIAASILRFENCTRSGIVPLLYTAYLAGIRYFVDTFVTGDWNPDFGGHKAPRNAHSHDVCSQNGTSAVFSGATLDYPSIIQGGYRGG